MLVVLGCNQNSQQKYLHSLKPTKPTGKERIFMDSLKRSGFKEVYLDIPIPGYGQKGASDYCVKLFFDSSLDKNGNELQDTMNAIGERIVDKLYCKIIEDSILVELRTITVAFYINAKPSEKALLQRQPYQTSIDDLKLMYPNTRK